MLIVKIEMALSNSIPSTSLSCVKVSWTTLYSLIKIRSDEINCAYLKFGGSYAKELIPRDAGGETTIVHINISVLAFPFIDTVNLKFTADFFLNLRSVVVVMQALFFYRVGQKGMAWILDDMVVLT